MRSPVIRAESLRRTYSVPVRREGVIGSLANLFVRRYRFVEALQDVSFEIHAGEVVGLIGPNGAGKSTTIKILTGILTPSSGIVQLLGYTPHLHRQVITRRIGAMFGQRTQLWWDLTPMDGFQMLRHIYDIPQAAFSRTLNDLSDALGLEAFIEQPVRKLSLGQRVRADVAASLLHEPAVVFLDEPMIGLDVLIKERVRALIARLSREKGVTVGVVEGINPVQLTTYSLLAFILARSLDSSISFYLGEAIKDGSIAIHLLRPINLQVWMLVRSLGESLFALLINGVPLLVTCALVFPLAAPASLAAAGLFLVSIALAALIGGTFSYLIGIVSFWTYNAWGVSILKQLLIITFSGSTGSMAICYSLAVAHQGMFRNFRIFRISGG